MYAVIRRIDDGRGDPVPELTTHPGVPTLEVMQAIVGGLVEALDIEIWGTRRITLWFREGARGDGAGGEFGWAARVTYLHSCPEHPDAGDQPHGAIFSPVIVTALDYATGETAGLLAEEAAGLKLGKHVGGKIIGLKYEPPADAVRRHALATVANAPWWYGPIEDEDKRRAGENV